MAFVVGVLVVLVIVAAWKLSHSIGSVPDYTFGRDEWTDQPTPYWTDRDPGDEC
jgi:hypothetical protein